MRGLRPLAAALAVACSLAGLPALAAQQAPAPAKPAAALAPSAASGDHAKALIAFQRDLVSVLSPSASPTPLLGAALLARPLPNQPEFNGFHKLINRAAAADRAGPEITWAQLADCNDKADDCPNRAALAKLATQAPDNAAVWLLKLGKDSHDGKQDDARADLSKAAAAKLYDDYTGAALKALATAVTTLPAPADVAAASQAGAAGALTLIVYGVAATLPEPGLQDTAKLCESAQPKTPLREDCLKLAKTLEWGSSPLARSLGLHLREMLSDDAAQQEEAKRARRDLVWQVQSYSQLAARGQTDKATAQHLLGLARNGGTEMSMILASLRDYGIAAEAPAGWTPAQPKGR